jgi:HSP20 family protein
MLVVKNKKWNTPSVFDQFFQRDLHQLMGTDFQSLTPQVNIIENELDYTLELAAPGLTKEELKVEIDKNVVVISAEKQKQTEGDQGQYLKREFSYHSFTRRFRVPEHADINATKANYENGILRVVFPKKEKKEGADAKTIVIS